MADKRLLRAKKKAKSRKPVFRRQEWFRTVSLGEKWRTPKGIDSKQKKGMRCKGKTPRSGFGSPRLVWGLNKQGFRDIRVFNTNDLQRLDPKKNSVIIAATVGNKKRIEIIKKAEDLKLKITNF